MVQIAVAVAGLGGVVQGMAGWRKVLVGANPLATNMVADCALQMAAAVEPLAALTGGRNGELLVVHYLVESRTRRFPAPVDGQMLSLGGDA